jgi:hypothetical protein
MADFSNYSELREDGTATKSFTFEELQGSPTIHSRPATSANSRYNNARLKALGKRTGGGRKKLRVSASTVEAARREDADMLSKFCVTGWYPAPVDASGEVVPFSADNCKEFFLAIPDWMFDEYRNWVADPLNFVADTGAEDEEEPESEDEVGNSLGSVSVGTSASSETASQ